MNLNGSTNIPRSKTTVGTNFPKTSTMHDSDNINNPVPGNKPENITFYIFIRETRLRRIFICNFEALLPFALN